MKKVDRLGWTAGVAFSAYHIKIGIRSNDAGVIKRLESRLIPAWWKRLDPPVVDYLVSLKIGKPSKRKGVRHKHLFYWGSGLVKSDLDQQVVMEELERHVQEFIGLMARNKLFIEASAGTWGDRGFILLGTDVEYRESIFNELIARGATAYSHSYAVLDGKGKIYPYPLPMPGRSLPSQVKISRKKSVPVKLVAILQPSTGIAGNGNMLSPAQTALEVIGKAITIRSKPKFVMDGIKAMCSQCKGIVFQPNGNGAGTKATAEDIIKAASSQ